MTNPLKTMSLEDSLRLRAERAEAERDKALAAVAEMREAISHVVDESKQADILCDDGFTMSFQKNSRVHQWLLHALSTDCGKDFVPRAELDKVRSLIYEPDMIRVSKDGNKWCAIIGENLQVGIAGFGDTPSEAVVELTKHDAFSEWSNNLH